MDSELIEKIDENTILLGSGCLCCTVRGDLVDTLGDLSVRRLKGAVPPFERVEAMMFLFFLALIIQAVIERQVRQSMSDNAIDAIPIYPEHRLAYHPTTAKIFDRFHDTSLYRVYQGQVLVNEYRDELTPVQQSVLALLGMTEEDYWRKLTQRST